LVELAISFSARAFFGPSSLGVYVKGLFVFSITAFSLAVFILLMVKMAAGKNWARITYTVCVACSLPLLPFIIVSYFAESIFIGVLALISVPVRLCALYLLYTQPSKPWFRRGEIAPEL
jgi:hypothetical protein